jgi:hypothetical protein
VTALHIWGVLDGDPAAPPEPGASSSLAPSHRLQRGLGWLVSAQVASLCACVALWGFSVSSMRVGTLDDYGLLPAFPLSFFVAIALLAVGFAAALCSVRTHQLVLAGHVLALIVFLHGTVPLLFSEPFYPWVYKHFGVVNYIDLHGRLDGSVDIYHNWPAFFTLSAWFSRVAGIRGPLEIAAWAQVFFNVCNMLQLRYVFGSLTRDIRLLWLAIFVFFAANWVAQDYFAPQAFAFTLSLGLCGVILRWLTVATDKALIARWLHRAAAFIVRLGRRRRSTVDPTDEPTGSQRFGRRAARNIALLLFAVVVASHQLTPYMLIGGLAVLTVLGVVRPRLLVVAFAAIALAYLLPRLEFVRLNYGLLTGAGDPLHNSRNATIGFNQGDPGRIFSAQASRMLSLAVWGLAIAGIVRRLRAGYKNLGVVVLAAAPAFIIFGESYGGEAIYRIYLFSLPWLALLAAFALRPGRHRWWSGRILPRVALAFLVLLALFLPSYFGMAEVNQVRSGEIAASEYFYRNAPPRSLLLLASPQFPIRLASNYEQFQLAVGESDPNLLAVKRSLRHRMLDARDLPVVAKVMRAHSQGGPAFLVVSKNGKAYSDVFNLLPAGSLDRLELALGRSREFRVWYRNDDATIYQLVDAPRSLQGPPRKEGDR